MSAINIRKINKTIAIKALKEKSPQRIKTFSSPGRVPKLDIKKSAAFTYESEGKNCMNSSKIPRPQATPSYSHKETLKNNLGKGKTKNAPSMIPRSKSSKRSENDKIKFDVLSKSNSSKEEFQEVSVSNSEKLISDLVAQESDFILLPDVKITKSSVSGEIRKPNFKQELAQHSSPNLKSSHNLLRVKEDNSDLSYKDAQENIVLPSVKPISWKGPSRQNKDPKDSENDEPEKGKQQRSILHLYETIKNTAGPLFENFRWSSSNKIPNSKTKSDSTKIGIMKEAKSTQDSLPDLLSIQDHYEFTLKEISNIWKNATSLISSVKDHTVKFVEENNASIDKEQLALEAEMLQLAIDFAISYSKLRTDFLIKTVRRSLNVEDIEKSELEAFIDSKTFAAVYRDEDLAAMARTVQDLSRSVMKGEDLEVE